MTHRPLEQADFAGTRNGRVAPWAASFWAKERLKKPEVEVFKVNMTSIFDVYFQMKSPKLWTISRNFWDKTHIFAKDVAHCTRVRTVGLRKTPRLNSITHQASPETLSRVAWQPELRAMFLRRLKPLHDRMV